MMKIRVGLCLLAIIGIFALLGPYLSGFSYYETDLEMKNLSPSMLHWFGTDDLGRDVFTRVWYGARISLLVGIAAALIDMVIGVLWGGLAAYFGGKTDDLMMGIADVLYALPYLLVVIVIMVAVGQGFGSILLAMTVIGWITMARIVRGKILQLKQQDFVMAAQSMGASHTRIFFGHLLPNAWEPIIVTITATIPSAIFVEAFLSFLGLGIQAPIASWGTMANEGLPALSFYPWRLLFPSSCICLTLVAFNLVGDGLRDLFE
jgi:oligopeptide transport system permease protein